MNVHERHIHLLPPQKNFFLFVTFFDSVVSLMYLFYQLFVIRESTVALGKGLVELVAALHPP